MTNSENTAREVANRLPYLAAVEEFHDTFEHPIRRDPRYPIDGKRAKLRFSLILEELSELACTSGEEASLAFHQLLVEKTREMSKMVQNAGLNKFEYDPTEALDALCDLQYVLSGAVLEYGFQDVFDKAFDRVHASNMTKACKDQDEAERNVKYYRDEKGVECTYKKARVDGKYLLLNAEGKTIKAMDYQPVQLNDLATRGDL